MSFDFQFKIETQKEIFAHLAEAIAIHKNKKKSYWVDLETEIGTKEICCFMDTFCS